MKLRIGADGSTLAPELAADVVSIVGRRGRGKTTTAVVLVEELAAAGARFCIADPVGVWYGLKSSRDGKAAGLPVIVMGGDHGDVPLEETAGKVIADFVADPESPSVILDFLHFRKGQMTRFMTDFLEEIYHRNRAALHLVLDEADKFAPQRVMGDNARLVGACEDVVKMGRARGILPMLISQRPAALNKNVLTQTGLLIAHALTGPHDRRAIDEWIRENADEAEREKFHASIAGLPRGTAWFWQPEAELFRQIAVRDRKTFDSSATPASGRAKPSPKVVADVDLAALTKRIAATIEKAKANDPKELQAKIRKLEQQLVGAPNQEAMNAAARKIEELAARVRELEAVGKRVEVPVLAKEDLARIEIAVEQFRGVAGHIDGSLGDFARTLSEVAAALANGHAPPTRSVEFQQPRKISTPLLKKRPEIPEENPGDLRPRHVEILQSLARYEQMGMRRVPNNRIALSMGLALSGSFNNYLSDLSTGGYIERADGAAELTERGRAAAGEVEALHSHEEVMALWRAKLPPRLVQILDVVLAAHPEAVSNEAVASALGLQLSGSFNNYLSDLSTLGLIKRRGGLATASEALFP